MGNNHRPYTYTKIHMMYKIYRHNTQIFYMTYAQSIIIITTKMVKCYTFIQYDYTRHSRTKHETQKNQAVADMHGGFVPMLPYSLFCDMYNRLLL